MKKRVYLIDIDGTICEEIKTLLKFKNNETKKESN